MSEMTSFTDLEGVYSALGQWCPRTDVGWSWNPKLIWWKTLTGERTSLGLQCVFYPVIPVVNIDGLKYISKHIYSIPKVKERE